jgi:hypothetical protein
MRAALILSCLWLACAPRPALSPADEVQYNTELLAAEESAASCREAVNNVAKVEERWKTTFAKFQRPVSPAPILICREDK